MRHNQRRSLVPYILLIVGMLLTRGFADNARPMAIVPNGYRLPAGKDLSWNRDTVTMRIASRGFAQGEIVYVEIVPGESRKDFAVACHYRSREVLLAKYPWGHRGFFAIAPNDPAGAAELSVVLTRDALLEKHTLSFTVAKTNFLVLRKSLKVGKYYDMKYVAKPDVSLFIRKCAEIKSALFKRFTPDAIRNRFSHPRDEHHITSHFWMKRLYERYTTKNGRKVVLKPQNNTHRGIDLRGKEGTPIFALADGAVAYADKMFYEGNFTVIDHGNRIFSYYMHQSTINVKAGELVKAGDVIGRVGSTGISTGAHLHVSLMVNGIHVDPLSILPIRVRE